jgi:hypothetical protein
MASADAASDRVTKIASVEVPEGVCQIARLYAPLTLILG